jgi:hypothetical protein
MPSSTDQQQEHNYIATRSISCLGQIPEHAHAKTDEAGPTMRAGTFVTP